MLFALRLYLSPIINQLSTKRCLLFMQQPLVNKCPDEPDRKTRTEYNPEGQLPAKARKGNEEK